MTYRIIIAPIAFRMLEAVADRRIQQHIRDRINSLTSDPELQGKPMKGEFTGYRSLRAVGQRYRILYRVERSQVLVVVVAVGIRKEGDRSDIYRLAQKLIRARLI